MVIRLADADIGRCEAPFVRYDTHCYVDGTALVDHLTDHGIGRLSVHADGSLFALVRVAEEPARATLLDLFDAKYGTAPGSEHRLVLRLVGAAAD